jgi:hypothetical protein
MGDVPLAGYEQAGTSENGELMRGFSRKAGLPWKFKANYNERVSFVNRQEIVISLQINLRITVKTEEGGSLAERFGLTGEPESEAVRIELPEQLPMHIEAAMVTAAQEAVLAAADQALQECGTIALEAAAAMESASPSDREQGRTAGQALPTRRAVDARTAKLPPDSMKQRPLLRTQPPHAERQPFIIARRSRDRRQIAVGKANVIAFEPARGPTVSGRPHKIPKRRIFRKHARSIGPPDKGAAQSRTFYFGPPFC